MKRFYLCLLSSLIASSFLNAATEVVEVTPTETTEILQQEAPIVLDVRTKEEYAEGHLKGAKNMDVTAADFEKKLETLDKSETYLVHCKSGGRSARAMKLLKKLGFTKVYHMNGGMMAIMARAVLPALPRTGRLTSLSLARSTVWSSAPVLKSRLLVMC